MTPAGRWLDAVKNLLRPLAGPRVPAAIAARFVRPGAESLARVEASLRRHYFAGSPAGSGEPPYLETAEGREDLHDHLEGRVESFRRHAIPWLCACTPLAGLRVLEVGCGTGSSTVALAEQGAVVTGIDVAEASLAVARERCAAFGLRVELACANAVDLATVFAGRRFDLVVFLASLEHMTLEERLEAIRSSWGLLPAGGFWCVIETPNRLWYFDQHTSRLPFFHWLPDDLALLYSRHSPRASFRERYRRLDAVSRLDFARWGRAMSYHELEVAIGPVAQLEVVSSLALFLRRGSVLRRAAWLLSERRQYERWLRRHGPPIHRGFYQEILDLVIRKT